MNRRDFLKTTAASAAVVSVPLLPTEVPVVQDDKQVIPVKGRPEEILDHMIKNYQYSWPANEETRKFLLRHIKMVMDTVLGPGEYHIHCSHLLPTRRGLWNWEKQEFSLHKLSLCLQVSWSLDREKKHICTYVRYIDLLPVVRWRDPSLVENIDEIFGHTPYKKPEPPVFQNAGYILRRAPAWLEYKDARGCSLSNDSVQLFWGKVEIEEIRSVASDLQFTVARPTPCSLHKWKKFKGSYLGYFGYACA